MSVCMLAANVLSAWSSAKMANSAENNGETLLFPYMEFDHDSSGAYDPSTGRFTCPVSGFYFTYFSVRIDIRERDHQECQLRLASNIDHMQVSATACACT